MSQWRITGGPSKFDLMEALFCSGLHEVSFGISLIDGNTHTSIKVTIDSVGRENGNGESWMIKGLRGQTRVTGYYTTKGPRGGLLTMEDDEVVQAPGVRRRIGHGGMTD